MKHVLLDPLYPCRPFLLQSGVQLPGVVLGAVAGVAVVQTFPGRVQDPAEGPGGERGWGEPVAVLRLRHQRGDRVRPGRHVRQGGLQGGLQAHGESSTQTRPLIKSKEYRESILNVFLKS